MATFQKKYLNVFYGYSRIIVWRAKGGGNGPRPEFRSLGRGLSNPEGLDPASAEGSTARSPRPARRQDRTRRALPRPRSGHLGGDRRAGVRAGGPSTPPPEEVGGPPRDGEAIGNLGIGRDRAMRLAPSPDGDGAGDCGTQRGGRRCFGRASRPTTLTPGCGAGSWFVASPIWRRNGRGSGGPGGGLIGGGALPPGSGRSSRGAGTGVDRSEPVWGRSSGRGTTGPSPLADGLPSPRAVRIIP
jgi:hypothetical protein